jgi:hypothetical protein
LLFQTLDYTQPVSQDFACTKKACKTNCFTNVVYTKTACLRNFYLYASAYTKIAYAKIAYTKIVYTKHAYTQIIIRGQWQKLANPEATRQ